VSVISPSAPKLDPRILRTRQMLTCALGELLTEKEFADISVQEISDRSTVNRATFYDHFPDKFALLDGMISGKFKLLLAERMAGAKGSCAQNLEPLIGTVCEFLAALANCPSRASVTAHYEKFDTITEAKMRAILREEITERLRADGFSESDANLRATTASGAICSAATAAPKGAEFNAAKFTQSLLPLVRPLLLKV
jgi:AcrR family transcriptional regulator